MFGGVIYVDRTLPAFNSRIIYRQYVDFFMLPCLLRFLKEESEDGCTVVYCTHIMDGLQGAFAWECWNNSDWIQFLVGKWSRFQKLCSELFCFKYLGFSICSRTRNSVATTSKWLNSICCQVDTHENAVTMASAKAKALNILYLKYSC